MNPLWIIVDDGDLFEGHQGHWADCFFSNAEQSVILQYCLENGYTVTFRQMTDEEVVKFPEAVKAAALIEKRYGVHNE